MSAAVSLTTNSCACLCMWPQHNVKLYFTTDELRGMPADFVGSLTSAPLDVAVTGGNAEAIKASGECLHVMYNTHTDYDIR